MLFLDEKQSRQRIQMMDDLTAGRRVSAADCEKLLESDPYDYVALAALGRLLVTAGDASGAERYFWRALEAQPGVWSSYVDLGILLNRGGTDSPLGFGLCELGFQKCLREELALEQLAGLPARLLGDDEDVARLSQRERVEALCEFLEEQREQEPEDVTARLRPFRLIHATQTAAPAGPALVDAILAEAEATHPLLTGILRGYAQNTLPDSDRPAVELSLALLGEMGDVSALPALLEFATLKDPGLSSTAGWAMERVFDKRPADSVTSLIDAATGLPIAPRLQLLMRLSKRPRLPGLAALLARLADNLHTLPKLNLALYLQVLCTVTVAILGLDCVGQLRNMVARSRRLLTRHETLDLQDAIASYEKDPPTTKPVEPSGVTVYEICARTVKWPEQDDGGRRPGPDFTSPPPPGFGRSSVWAEGGGPETADSFLVGPLDAERQRTWLEREISDNASVLRGLTISFVREYAAEVGLEEARNSFLHQQLDENLESPLFADWLMHDYVVPRWARTAIQHYINPPGRRMDDDYRFLLEAWAASYVGIYEVVQVRAGAGVRIRGLLSKDTCYVRDWRLADPAARGHFVMGRVLQDTRSLFFNRDALPVPRAGIPLIRDWLDRELKRTRLTLRDYSKRELAGFYRKVCEVSRDLEAAPALLNSDGEQLCAGQADFRMQNYHATLAALRSAEQFSDVKKGRRFHWVADASGDAGPVLLGKITCNRSGVTLECNSRERLERGRHLLESIAGDGLRHAGDRSASLAGYWLKPPSYGLAPAASPDRKEAARGQALEDICAAWVDRQHPALDGVSPREAVKTPAGKRKVLDLLREMEEAESQGEPAGEPYLETWKLKALLGLLD